jgi:hypothetical protein
MLRLMQAGILAIHHQFAIVVVTTVVSLLGMTLMAGEEQAGEQRPYGLSGIERHRS